MDELFDWLTVIRAPGMTARRGHELLGQFQSASEIREAGTRDLKSVGLDNTGVAFLKSPDSAAINNDVEFLSRPDTRLIPFTSSDYPALLRQIPDPPLALFVRGDPSVLHMPQLAMVGSRNPSQGGRETAFHFAQHLAESGITVTSGLALGIDTECHRGALSAHESGHDATGKTIAVMGTGIDTVYPAQQQSLAEDIASHGALVSEFPPCSPPKREHFPQRNRIISGMALGVLVVEAAHRSGSLITARHASEQGREVFAIPGSIHNPMARGCHRLIREGAKLVESAADIFEELESLAGSLKTGAGATDQNAAQATSDDSTGDVGSDAQYGRLLDALEYDAQPIDRIIQRTGLTADEVSSMLLILELEGKVTSAPGGRYARVMKRVSE